MTGPEHYREAELLSKLASNFEGKPRAARVQMGQVAQVHAILALAAATALGHEGEGRTQPSKDRAAWFEAASECKKETR